jgi:hypothetical protein
MCINLYPAALFQCLSRGTRRLWEQTYVQTMEFVFRQGVTAGTSYRMMIQGRLAITTICQTSRLITSLSSAESKQIITFDT